MIAPHFNAETQRTQRSAEGFFYFLTSATLCVLCASAFVRFVFKPCWFGSNAPLHFFSALQKFSMRARPFSMFAMLVA